MYKVEVMQLEQVNIWDQKEKTALRSGDFWLGRTAFYLVRDLRATIQVICLIAFKVVDMDDPGGPFSVRF